MTKRDSSFVLPEGLDISTLQLLAEHQPEVNVPATVRDRLRTNIMSQIAQEDACTAPGFTTVRAQEGEWLEPQPGAKIKILHQEGDSGLLTYLVRLAPGFEMQGHMHPFPEECLMLEGDLWFGSLHLKAGDYHFADKGVYHGRLKTENGAVAFLKGALPSV